MALPMTRGKLFLVVPLIGFAAFSVALKVRLLERAGASGVLPVGSDVPPIVLKSLDGERVELAEVAARSKIVIVNFWATWCRPCRVEMPQLQKAYEQHRDEGLEILAVTSEAREPVEELLRERGYTFPVLLDPGGRVTTAYGVEAIPTTVIVGSDGKVIRSHRGLYPFLDRLISELLRTGGRERRDGAREGAVDPADVPGDAAAGGNAAAGEGAAAGGDDSEGGAEQAGGAGDTTAATGRDGRL